MRTFSMQTKSGSLCYELAAGVNMPARTTVITTVTKELRVRPSSSRHRNFCRCRTCWEERTRLRGYGSNDEEQV